MKYSSSLYTPDIISAYIYYGSGVSAESKQIVDQLETSLTHFLSPVYQVNLEERFNDLKATWESDTMSSSSVEQIVLHPAYQQIIGMGERVLPFIFNDLARGSNHWFWALKTITGQDPVKEKNRGRINKMKEAWINWAIDHEYYRPSIFN